MKHLATKLALTALTLTGVSACSPHGRNTTKLQYMPDMADNPTVKTQESYLNPPDGAVTFKLNLDTETPELGGRKLRNTFG